MNASLIDRFTALAREEAATTERVAGPRQVPAAVVKYLRAQGLDARLNVVGRPGGAAVAWDAAPDLVCSTGPVAPDGDTVVTGCYAGVAESGALVLLSSAADRAEANFLAATHIVIIQSDAFIASFEDLWARLRADFPHDLPRTMSFVVGPSRTADLGVPSKLGAHGPARLHIIIVDRQ